MVSNGNAKNNKGAFRESNSGPLAPKARIIPLDHKATDFVAHMTLIRNSLSFRRRMTDCFYISIPYCTRTIPFENVKNKENKQTTQQNDSTISINPSALS